MSPPFKPSQGCHHNTNHINTITLHIYIASFKKKSFQKHYKKGDTESFFVRQISSFFALSRTRAFTECHQPPHFQKDYLTQMDRPRRYDKKTNKYFS